MDGSSTHQSESSRTTGEHQSENIVIVCSSIKLRLHIVLKPVPKPVSIELVWKLPGVNALKPVSKPVRKPLPGGGLKPASMWFRRARGG